MEPIHLNAADDPRLAPYRNLRTKADEGFFIVESEFAVMRLLASGWPLHSVVATPARVHRIAAALGTRAPLFVAERQSLSRLVGFEFHRGVLACAPRPSWPAPDWERLVRQPRATVLALSAISDPANLGSLVRSARALACDLILIDARCTDPLSRRAIRGSMGHVFAQPIAQIADLHHEIARSRDLGVKWWASTPRSQARPVLQAAANRPAHCGLMVGHEGFGLASTLIEAADQEVTIPMANGVDSLGVAAATAAILVAMAAFDAD